VDLPQSCSGRQSACGDKTPEDDGTCSISGQGPRKSSSQMGRVGLFVLMPGYFVRAFRLYGLFRAVRSYCFGSEGQTVINLHLQLLPFAKLEPSPKKKKMRTSINPPSLRDNPDQKSTSSNTEHRPRRQGKRPQLHRRVRKQRPRCGERLRHRGGRRRRRRRRRRSRRSVGCLCLRSSTILPSPRATISLYSASYCA